MMKSKVYTAVGAISVMCMIGGCRNNSEDVSIPMESVADDEASNTEEVSTETESVSSLTDESNTALDIDYEIESYQNIQDFSYQLFSEQLEAENPVLSPTSAYLALAMAGFGSEGNTKAQFHQVLGEDMLAMSDHLMNMLPVDSERQILSLANSAWIDDQYIVDEKWIGTIKSVMDAEAYQTNLSTIETMDSMNGWIEEKTNGLIDKMLEKPLTDDARLVLFNTIYFKGKWCNPFEANDTYADTFQVNDREQVETNMMHKYSENLDYVSNDFAEGLILPYRTDTEDHNIAMMALKPKGTDVREMYRQLSADNVSELIDNRQSILINTKIPKFEISFENGLNESLINMGLVDGFDAEKADFSLMGRTAGGYNLYISLVKQKAKIIVDEEGTEAAAATEVAMLEGCALIEEEPIDVFFDEPFLYMIMDMDREIPLFIGILDNPAETND